MIDDEAPNRPKYHGLFTGIVDEDADPEGRYRVRVRVPALDEHVTDWAPIVCTGGGMKRGGGVPMAKGDCVALMFELGDIERPFILGGWFGVRKDEGPEIPAPARDAGAEAHRVSTLQIGRFLISADEREDQLLFKVTGVDAEQTHDVVSLELDLKNGGIILTAEAGIILKCDGLIHLDSTAVRLKDRLVAVSSKQV